jgi:N-sulfoglucosamine sulfohydrolase
MRSRTQLPEIIPVYPKILREAGYYCTNNVKKDYNSNYEDDNTIWDESSNQAHYRNRKSRVSHFLPVFNNTVTHESQLESKTEFNIILKISLIPEIPRVILTILYCHRIIPICLKSGRTGHDCMT